MLVCCCGLLCTHLRDPVPRFRRHPFSDYGLASVCVCVCVALISPRDPTQTVLPPGSEVFYAILSFQSCGVYRVTHASFDFEAISAVSSLDMLMNMREIVGEATISVCPSSSIERGEARQRWRGSLPRVERHTDSMGLVKVVRLSVSQSLSSRRRRDILAQRML